MWRGVAGRGWPRRPPATAAGRATHLPSAAALTVADARDSWCRLELELELEAAPSDALKWAGGWSAVSPAASLYRRRPQCRLECPPRAHPLLLLTPRRHSRHPLTREGTGRGKAAAPALASGPRWAGAVSGRAGRAGRGGETAREGISAMAQDPLGLRDIRVSPRLGEALAVASREALCPALSGLPYHLHYLSVAAGWLRACLSPAKKNTNDACTVRTECWLAGLPEWQNKRLPRA